jgi:hypothetical protein
MRGAILIFAVGLMGCAAHTTEKPLITARAFQRIAADCGATKPDVHRTKNNPLPFVSAQLPKAEGEEGASTPVSRLHLRTTKAVPLRHVRLHLRHNRRSEA